MHNTDPINMRLPIAFTPLNCLLIILMLMAPYLGKVAREQVEEKAAKKNLDQILASRLSANQSKKAKLKRKRKKAVSRLTMLEKVESNKNIEAIKKQKPNVPTQEHQFRSNQPQNHNGLLQSEQTKILAQARQLKPEENKKALVSKLKKLARNRNFSEAEKVFLSQLEDMNLSPLESLEKQAKFQDHFKRLVDQLEVNQNL